MRERERGRVCACRERGSKPAVVPFQSCPTSLVPNSQFHEEPPAIRPIHSSRLFHVRPSPHLVFILHPSLLLHAPSEPQTPPTHRAPRAARATIPTLSAADKIRHEYIAFFKRRFGDPLSRRTLHPQVAVPRRRVVRRQSRKRGSRRQRARPQVRRRGWTQERPSQCEMHHPGRVACPQPYPYPHSSIPCLSAHTERGLVSLSISRLLRPRTDRTLPAEIRQS